MKYIMVPNLNMKKNSGHWNLAKESRVVGGEFSNSNSQSSAWIFMGNLAELQTKKISGIKIIIR